MVGFGAKNQDKIDPLYICPGCSLVLREPFQLSCGHRRCKTCIENIEGDIVKCAECQKNIPINEIARDRGCTNDMQLIPITCSLCEWDGLYKDYEEHRKQSHEQLVCQGCGQVFGSMSERDEHNKSKCFRTIISCPVMEYTPSNRLNESQSLNNSTNILRPDVTPNGSDALGDATNNIRDETPPVVSIHSRQTDPISTVLPVVVNNDDPMEEIHETLNSLVDTVETLNDDTQHLHNESIRLQTSIESLTQEFQSLRVSHEEQSAFLNGVRHIQDILQQDVAFLNNRIDDMQYVSYDGTLIWKITNFREKMMNAQSERQTSIYSPPFYSSPNGYKMRARLYLNGDGNARQTHMSLYFVLMRGPNDPILEFPFNYKVTFCLFDQTPAQRHIINSFRPDIKSNSFQRPQSEMNIASGIPRFFPLAMIQQEGNPYVRDDTMFIKVMVDFGDMPKTLLPYALSLNPGLPMHVQQLLIEQEAERRAAQQPSQQTPTSPANRPITMASPPNNEEQSLPEEVSSSNTTDETPTGQDEADNTDNS